MAWNSGMANDQNNPPGRARRRLLPAIVGTLVLHVVAAALLIWQAQRSADLAATVHPDQPRAASGADGEDSSESIDMSQPASTDPDDVAAMIRDQLSHDASIPEAHRVEALAIRAESLKSIDAESVESLASITANAAGASSSDSRAWAPDPRFGDPIDTRQLERADDPETLRQFGEAMRRIDTDSVVLHDVRPATDPDTGRTVYEHVYVDKAGRSFLTAIPAGEMTPQQMRLTRVYEMSRENEKLRPLIDAVMRIAASQSPDQSQDSGDQDEKIDHSGVNDQP